VAHNLYKLEYRSSVETLVHQTGQICCQIKNNLTFEWYRPVNSDKLAAIICTLLILGWWYLMLLSTIFQLYRGGQLYWWRISENPEKTIDLPKVTDRLLHNVVHVEYTSPWAGFELSTLMVIGTDCTAGCRSNYPTIMTTTAPMCLRDYNN
jgi:hypothetical protein